MIHKATYNDECEAGHSLDQVSVFETDHVPPSSDSNTGSNFKNRNDIPSKDKHSEVFKKDANESPRYKIIEMVKDVITAINDIRAVGYVHETYNMNPYWHKTIQLASESRQLLEGRPLNVAL
jgi:hypothetical protein